MRRKPKIYRIDMQVVATAYVRATSAKQARKMAKDACEASLTIHKASCLSDIEISERQLDDPFLPDLSISPCLTILRPWPGDRAEIAED